MTRYETRWYVTTTAEEAKRLAAIDHTPAAEIRITHDVDIIHGSGSWAYWSDGRLTKSVSGVRGGGLSAAACRILGSASSSDSGLTIDAGIVAAIASMTETEVACGPERGVYSRERLRRLDCTMVDGSHRQLWLRTAGYPEGYEYELTEEDPR